MYNTNLSAILFLLISLISSKESDIRMNHGRTTMKYNTRHLPALKRLFYKKSYFRLILFSIMSLSTIIIIIFTTLSTYNVQQNYKQELIHMNEQTLDQATQISKVSVNFYSDK